MAWANWAQDLGYNGASSRSRFSLNKIITRIISTIKCYFRLYCPKNWEFCMICQLAACDDRHDRHTTIHHDYSFIQKAAVGRAGLCCCIEVYVGITFQDGDRFNSCQVIYSHFGLAIHQNDHQARRRFVEWAQNEIAVVPDFHKRILFSDEVHFWLNGYVNKQNCRIWSEANPQVYVETPLHPEN
ncbi:hypothetical protein TNCV_923911 [Trichonephila clavipes]|nr:hypothetical protein TNCV_923911 [Trichonephila clavipes]